MLCRYFSNRNNYAIDRYYVVFDWCAHSQCDWKDVLFYGIVVEKANIIGDASNDCHEYKCVGVIRMSIPIHDMRCPANCCNQIYSLSIEFCLNEEKKNVETCENEHVCVCVCRNEPVAISYIITATNIFIWKELINSDKYGDVLLLTD